MTILLERNEQRYNEIHCPVCPLPHSSSLPTPDERDFSMSFQKDCHRFSLQMQNLMFRQQTYSYHNRPPQRMARSISNTWQICWYHSIYFHQPVSSSSYVPRYILLDNGTEFKNQLMDKLLQQLGIECIFSTSYDPQSNGKLEVFHKYLKPTLKKLCEMDPANWDKYINKGLASYRVRPNLAMAEVPFFLIYGRDPNLPLHQLLEPMQRFLGDPESGLLNLEAHYLALAIA